MPAAQLAAHVAGCAAVVSALAHETAWRGVPRAGIGMGGRDLCTGVARRVCEAVARVGPDVPVKYVMLGWVDDDVYPEADAASVLARVERGVVTALKACFPPWMDTATAARYLVEEVGAKDPFVEWVVVRTGVGRDGRVGAYVVGERRGLFAGGVHGDATTGWTTTRANVAHFVGELVARDGVWAEWRGRMPLVCDAK
ncbi:uncharacterized protein EV422DRAFT_547554 [Fimicolochytrium jonesii]|uniref:uncharacterized protein n=1 Tax=Fimicolochytrium jonesii TaxID=1396493 RepID=UPI0022FEF7BC|nr:uncharacterized protein EV422DRAFT_547554 [Fimicolochytrium jonesii]KAI8816030.1 hypothetical protein EV422DRAFT_547554 [Fimicolochytrium jonesii]